MSAYEVGLTNSIKMVFFLSNYKIISNMSLKKSLTYGLNLIIYNQLDQSLLQYLAGKVIILRAGLFTDIKLRKRISQSLPKPYSECEDLEPSNSPLVKQILS